MSGEPAIRKVLVRTKEWLDDVSGSGVPNYIDRPFNQPFRDEDFPLVNIRCQRVDFDVFTYSAWLHTAQVMFDIITRSSTIATGRFFSSALK